MNTSSFDGWSFEIISFWSNKPHNLPLTVSVYLAAMTTILWYYIDQMQCILKDYKPYNHPHGRHDWFSANLLVDTDLSIAVHLDQNLTWCGCMAAHSSGPLEPIDIRLFQPAEVISVGTNHPYSIVRVICWFRMTNHQTVICIISLGMCCSTSNLNS